MSKRRDDNGRGAGNSLLILILIVLQFSCRERREHDHEGCSIDNGILFIIALFFLACCGNFNLCCCNGN